eukprot:31157-Pelagococcus_subviridis.AAC.17
MNPEFHAPVCCVHSRDAARRAASPHLTSRATYLSNTYLNYELPPNARRRSAPRTSPRAAARVQPPPPPASSPPSPAPTRTSPRRRRARLRDAHPARKRRGDVLRVRDRRPERPRGEQRHEQRAQRDHALQRDANALRAFPAFAFHRDERVRRGKTHHDDRLEQRPDRPHEVLDEVHAVA